MTATGSLNVREPLCNYYSSSPAQLCKEIEGCVKFYPEIEKVEQGLDDKSRGVNVPIYLVPHGAFCDSGPLVAEVFKILKIQHNFFAHNETSPEERTIFLIGTEHASRTSNFITLATYSYWKTPLGNVMNNDNICKQILEQGRGYIVADNAGFVNEHSIENQLPFLQYFHRQSEKDGDKLKIVAINVHSVVREKNISHIEKVSMVISNIVSQHSSQGNNSARIAIISTTDYTHAGPGYGEMPSDISKIPQYIRSRDTSVIKSISQMESCIEILKKGTQISMCGLGAALLTVEMARNLNKTKGNLLKYAVGSDICDRGVLDQTGFASFAFE